METVHVVIQIIIALGIYNVWLLRSGKSTGWRGAGADSLKEEFEAYGLPAWAVPVVGTIKVSLATALLAGIWYPALVEPAALGMAVMMTGAIAMHFKVKDPLKRSLPAFVMLVLSLILVLT